MKHIFTSSVTAILIAMVIATNAYADGLQAQINTTQVAEGDQFQLVLTIDGQAANAPDLSPLSADFNVLGTSQSSQTQIINGQASHSMSWIVTLSPKTKGQLTIPSLSAGSLTSDPVTITVVDASQLPKLQGAGGISVSAAIAGDSHYVFQEIPLTLRIEAAVPLQRAELVVPGGDFEMSQTGQDRSSQITRNGQVVNVIERSFLLRPQVEGEMTIPPFTLRGSVHDPNARRDPFADFGFGSSMMQQMMNGSPFGSMFDRGKPFTARSDPITLNVLANPDAGPSDWFLPAKSVQIEAEWQPANPAFREGEAVTRQVSLLVLGARPEQLPDLTFTEPNGARIYLDDTRSGMGSTTDGTIARKDFQISVVPTRGGQVILPEISVEWLNTETDQTETAILPALTINVEGTIPVADPVNRVADAQVTVEPVVAQSTNPNLAYFGAGLAVLLVGAAAFIHYRRKAHQAHGVAVQESQDRVLRRCARNGDQTAFYQALLGLRSNPGQANRAELEKAIAEFERLTFAQDGTGSGPDLHSILKNVFPGTSTGPLGRWFKGRRKQLAPLYPALQEQ